MCLWVKQRSCLCLLVDWRILGRYRLHLHNGAATGRGRTLSLYCFLMDVNSLFICFLFFIFIPESFSFIITSYYAAHSASLSRNKQNKNERNRFIEWLLEGTYPLQTGELPQKIRAFNCIMISARFPGFSAHERDFFKPLNVKQMQPTEACRLHWWWCIKAT